MASKQYGSDPATKHYTVVPNDTDPQLPLPRALYASTQGVIQITDEMNTTVYYPVVAGQILPIRAYKIGTGTTATVVAWF